MLAVFILGTLFIMISTGMALVQMARSGIERQLRYHGQAVNAAQAGLVEGLAWYRRQTTQPVADFAPQRDPTAVPPINETDDPSIGIVREYEIDATGPVRGRYEVPTTGAMDVTGERAKSGTGTVWALESRGFIYLQRDASVPFDTAPNVILSRSVARTEIQRLSIVLPANAAINGIRGDKISTETRTRIYGGGDTAIAYPASTGAPSVSGELTGNPALSQVDPYNDGIFDVFGVTLSEIIAMADIVVTIVDDLPEEIPDMALIVIDGDAKFTPSRRLSGTGVLIVLGNMTIVPNSYSSYDGLIYVTGDYTQNAPSQISGSIISQGAISIRGTGDFSEVFYDEPVLTQIRRHMGQYRFARNQQYSPR